MPSLGKRHDQPGGAQGHELERYGESTPDLREIRADHALERGHPTPLLAPPTRSWPISHIGSRVGVTPD